MARIFISYRRADSQAWADRIYPVLVQAFGVDNVFKDVDSINLSRNFRAAIERAVINSDVVLILIGRQWVTITDDSGRKRLDNPDDYVRLEAEMALRHDKMVIPVTVDEARMPSTADLPATLQDVPFLNGAGVRGDPDFDHDMGRLIRNIQELTYTLTATAPTETLTKARIGDAAAAMEAEDFQTAIRLLKAEQARSPTGRLARIVNNMLAEAERDLARQMYLNNAEVEYRPIADMIHHARTRSAGCTELADFHQQYPDYDPDNLATVCAEAAKPLTPEQPISSITHLPNEIPTQSSPTAVSQPHTRKFATSYRTILFGVVSIASLILVGSLLVSQMGKTVQGNLSTPPGFTPITRNTDWTPVEQDFDGVTMVLVPAGCFDMGSHNGSLDEQPINNQCFSSPFWIDKYEVANDEFAQFDSIKSTQSAFTESNHPVERISYREASGACALRKMRLPTEREWEYAARGPDNLVYPWGNAWDENNAVWGGNSNSHTAEVGSRPAGISWVGALDLSGNVWEWVSSAYEPYPYKADDGREVPDGTNRSHVVRGGSWIHINTSPLRSSDRYSYDQNYRDYNVGFRCARDY